LILSRDWGIVGKKLIATKIWFIRLCKMHVTLRMSPHHVLIRICRQFWFRSDFIHFFVIISCPDRHCGLVVRVPAC
jgi:hypothetical protein